MGYSSRFRGHNSKQGTEEWKRLPQVPAPMRISAPIHDARQNLYRKVNNNNKKYTSMMFVLACLESEKEQKNKNNVAIQECFNSYKGGGSNDCRNYTIAATQSAIAFSSATRAASRSDFSCSLDTVRLARAFFCDSTKRSHCPPSGSLPFIVVSSDSRLSL